MNALYISLMVLFIHATSWDGMINSWIKKVVKPEGKFYKALYGCPICMTPWWGTLLYLILFRNCLSFSSWFAIVGAASGLSVIWVCVLTVRIYLLKNKT